MPLNVVDNYGKHVGIIVSKYDKYFVVAMTDESIGNYMESFREQLKAKAAQAWQCKNMFGKINEEKFLASLKQWIPTVKPENFDMGKSLDLYAVNKEQLLQFNLVKAFPAATYILTEGKLMDDYYNIKLGLSYSRIPGLGINKGFAAVVGEVATIPEVSIPSQTTALQIDTGDTEMDVSLPGIIVSQKGADIALELDFNSGRIARVYVNEMIYNL